VPLELSGAAVRRLGTALADVQDTAQGLSQGCCDSLSLHTPGLGRIYCFAQPQSGKRKGDLHEIFFQIQYVAACVGGCRVGGCAQSYHEKEERYVLIAANINLPYWQEAAAGLRDVARNWRGSQSRNRWPASYSPKEEVDAFQKAVSPAPPIMVSVASPECFKRPYAAAMPAASR